MLFKELIQSGLMKDDDKITVSKPIAGHVYDIRKGNWFEDQILDFLNYKVKELSYNDETGFSVSLEKDASRNLSPSETDFSQIAKIGGSFSFDLKDGRSVSVVVADVRDGETYFVFDRLYWFHPMNYDYKKKASWETSDMAKFLNTEVLNQLPDDLAEIIQPREIGNWSGKLWLPSYEEVFGDEQFEIFKETSNRIMSDDKKIPRSWWLRSACYTINFGRVSSSGRSTNYNANYSIGACPGFIVKTA